MDNSGSKAGNATSLGNGPWWSGWGPAVRTEGRGPRPVCEKSQLPLNSVSGGHLISDSDAGRVVCAAAGHGQADEEGEAQALVKDVYFFAWW